jgi:hypothetical protein
MVSESRSYVQFPPTMQFFAPRIPPSLVFTGLAGMATPEREQTAPTAVARTKEEEYWTIA